VSKGPRLSIALLGAPLVEIDKHPLVVDTRKATALLAYLAVTDRPARRDTLAALLWPDTDPDRARSALRRTLSTLRAGLDGGWLAAGREQVTLDSDGVWLDVAELRRLVGDCATHGHPATATCDRCLEPLRAAAALDRGTFLAGFGLRDSAAFDDWQQLVGDELEREVGGVLDRLAEVLAARGDHAEAISVARRRLAFDPLHEPAHRRLIGIYAAAGDRSAAMEQYRECVRSLDRELGVRPLDETTALYHSILEGTYAPPAPRPVTAPTPDRDETTPLVGRDDECERLERAYERVGPDGRLVILSGEAGIGKTRLAEEFLASVERVGGRAVGVRCSREEVDLAYGVVSQLTRAAVAAAGDPPHESWWRAEVSRLLPELGPPPTDTLDSVAAQARFYDAIVELVEAAGSGECKAAVFVDDVHWADEASLGLLSYLARRLRGRSVLLVLSLRPEDVPRGQRAERLLMEARRDPSSAVLVLSRLSAPEVAELVRARGGNGDLSDRLYEETKGLPFFVVEYLAAIGRDADATSWPLPGGVRDLLASRLAPLDDLARQVVAAGAVLGTAFDADAVRETSGRSEEETVYALEELVARGILVETSDGSLDFLHEQARELVVEEMTLARRRLLHRRAAAALDTRDGRDHRAAVVARHLQLAGDDTAAAELYVIAGARARSLYANLEALGHYRAALALGYPNVGAVHREIGDLETLEGDYGGALASYEAAAASADVEARATIDHRLGLLHLRRGEWELAEIRLATASATLSGAQAPRVLASRALARHRSGSSADAASLARDALRAAESCGDRMALADSHNVLGILAGDRGDHDGAMTHLGQSLELARTAGDPSAQVAAANNLARAHAAMDDLERAIELTREGLEVCVTIGDRHREAAVRNNLADLLHRAGREEESMTELKHAVTLFAEVGEEGRLEPEIWKLSEW
jgi:DNA-binding SARP family transcriptional activator